MSYKILDAYWFTNTSLELMTGLESACIGIVAVETYTDEWKAYIGVSNGVSSEGDKQLIAMLGSGLFAEQAAPFFPRLDITKYKKEGL